MRSPLKNYWFCRNFFWNQKFLYSLCCLGILFIIPSAPLRAYTGEIQAVPDEIWNAVKQVLKPHGISKENAAKKQIESQWIEDQVVRSLRLFPIGPKTAIKQTVDRRYRIRIRLEQEGNDSVIRVIVRGIFQQKQPETRPSPMSWQSVRPQLADYDIERDFFFKILRQMEDNRISGA